MAIFNNPYPILSNINGNFNDLDSEFNCIISNIEFSDNKYKFNIKAEVLNEPVIEDLLIKGDVEFVIRVNSKPFFRKTYKTTDSYDTINFEIDYKELSSEFSFEISPQIITTKKIIYKNENADSPMDDYEFHLLPKQKVAEHNEIKIVFERGYKLFDTGPLISISKLKGREKPQHGAMDIDLGNNYNIIVHFSESNYDKIITMNRINPRVLSTTLGNQVIYHTLSAIKDNPDNFKEIDWAVMLNDKFDVFNLETADEVLQMTDLILNSPLINLYEYYIKIES